MFSKTNLKELEVEYVNKALLSPAESDHLRAISICIMRQNAILEKIADQLSKLTKGENNELRVQS